MSKPIAQITATDLFGEDGPQILQYPTGSTAQTAASSPRCAADDAEDDAGQGSHAVDLG
jgi:hypothetical protein